ncbi:precorrin-6A synthase (deacetylating) [Bosea sp. SSUT16]|jgi:precorrin-6A synthase|uniref:Precorrin-6A synthase [deacetylating] n=1 Tax=Bosea spartocytisi TaxID=2773451 RepID=A0A927E8C5_9HYPH|nr:precorrin-6A synthase (deacetylating) [Bosea spartocytisi]MBD3845195.1 precorrin-6A synthase (deacetylating) [Bosea spartocytisi]MCT4472366.1 precorrin-6A synthase (deacetylating) [Bosea spartocytisi]
MRNILVIGIGAGNPDHVTIEAIEALNRADVLFIPDKGEEKAALRHLREAICARFIRKPGYRSVPVTIPRRAEAGDDYPGVVDDWHARIAASYRGLFESELAEGETGALLVWGDPALYDSTLRIMERVAASGLDLDWQVYPGISSVQVLAARHRIPLNTIGAPILITTGRRLAAGFPVDQDSVVVMLDGEQAFAKIAPDGLDIFWGAYLGTADEILLAGPLAQTLAEITRVRAEARARHGWIMDTYLLRRRVAA